jgi:hypothetical protein
MIAQIRKRNRVSLTITLLAVILLGLASRKYPFLFPAFLGKYPGDALWAIMVYLGLELLMPKASIGFIATCALAISYLDEFSQLIQTPWLNAIRSTVPGHLILGTSFSWWDMLAYSLGIALAASVGHLLGKFR